MAIFIQLVTSIRKMLELREGLTPKDFLLTACQFSGHNMFFKQLR